MPVPDKVAHYAQWVQVEASQTMIRIVGLSATLPNHEDVGRFLGVSATGLFYFGPEYRPVPLEMGFVGVTEKNMVRRNLLMGEIAYEKVAASLEAGNQCMVFVHSRKDTAKTSEQLANWAASNGVCNRQLAASVHLAGRSS
jgi:activating signal cointegrator complex subunit 3